ncbi:MAG: glycosyltransferase family 2 protein [Candidatus Krumholzibacteriia bacterium]
MIASKAALGATAVVIPAWNAARHLAGVLERVAVFKLPVIVVDDGSDDGSGALARAHGVHVVVHPRNLGKGAALASGIDKARSLDMQFVITLDADGQHNPDEIPRFIERQAATGADVIVGNRMGERGDMPPLRVFANRVTSAFVSLRAHARVPDSQNGYRMLRTSLFDRLRLETTRYDTESEILIKAGRAGAKIDSVPVETIYGTEKSGVNPLVDTLRFLRLVLKSLFW